MSPTRACIGRVAGRRRARASRSRAGSLHLASDVAAAIVQPIGDLWLNALQMTVVPLVVALVVLGVASTSDAAAVRPHGAAGDLSVFLVLLSAGAAFAALFAPFQLSLLPRDPELIASLRAAIGTPVDGAAPTGFARAHRRDHPEQRDRRGRAERDAAAGRVRAVLRVRADARRARRARAGARAVPDAGGRRWSSSCAGCCGSAPLGVFALAFGVCVKAGVGVLSALGVVRPRAVLALPRRDGSVCISSPSSPAASRCGGSRRDPAGAGDRGEHAVLARDAARDGRESRRTGSAVRPRVTALVLPMAVSLFRMTSPVQYIGVSCYIAWIYGVDLSAEPARAWAPRWRSSSASGSVGLPGQVSLMATNMPVAQAMGLPVAPLGLLLAVETIPDAFATLGNVTGDLAATTVVARRARRTLPTPDHEHAGAIDAVDHRRRHRRHLRRVFPVGSREGARARARGAARRAFDRSLGGAVQRNLWRRADTRADAREPRVLRAAAARLRRARAARSRAARS